MLQEMTGAKMPPGEVPTYIWVGCEQWRSSQSGEGALNLLPNAMILQKFELSSSIQLSSSV